MNKKQTKQKSVRCKATAKTGKPCKKMSVPGYDFCQIHGFGKIKGTPWYENGFFLTLGSLVIASLFAYVLFLKGPSQESQNEILAKQDKSDSKQDATLTIVSNTIFEDKPSVSLDVGPVLDAKDPWGTGLIICNQDTHAISNIWAVAYWHDPNNPTKGILFSRAALNPVPELLPTMKQGLHFASFGPPTPSPFPPFDSKTWVNIDIRYTPRVLGKETNHVFQFCIAKNGEGNYIWIPCGEGRSMSDFQEELANEQNRIIDVIPFLNVKIDSVQDISQTKKDYPIQINYSWSNSGGKPATLVYVEWAALYSDGSPHMIWNHHGEASGQMLWPGMTNNSARVYNESPAHDVLSGITNGTLTLAGVVFYKDLDKHEFAMQVKAQYTNATFETKLVGIGGYFLELQNEITRTNSLVK